MKRVCLITGASGDIGGFISKRFAKEGYNLVLCFNTNKDKVLKLKSELESTYNIEVLPVKVDISNEEEINNLISIVTDKYDKVDALVNNAAIEVSSDINDKNKESFRKVLDVNVIGTFMITKAIAEVMMKNKSGKIVNISSNNGIDKYDPYTLEYDVSKSAINLMTKSLAKYYAPYINVNAVAPGWVMTDKIIELDEKLDNKFISSESEKILLKRFAKPEEIAELVYFLCSDNASYINGEIIKIDGGSYE